MTRRSLARAAKRDTGVTVRALETASALGVSRSGRCTLHTSSYSDTAGDTAAARSRAATAMDDDDVAQLPGADEAVHLTLEEVDAALHGASRARCARGPCSRRPARPRPRRRHPSSPSALPSWPSRSARFSRSARAWRASAPRASCACPARRPPSTRAGASAGAGARARVRALLARAQLAVFRQGRDARGLQGLLAEHAEDALLTYVQEKAGRGRGDPMQLRWLTTSSNYTRPDSPHLTQYIHTTTVPLLRACVHCR